MRNRKDRKSKGPISPYIPNTKRVQEGKNRKTGQVRDGGGWLELKNSRKSPRTEKSMFPN